MRVHDVTYNSVVNGVGKTTILHLQGCKIHCVGCFSKHTWDHAGGKILDKSEVIELMVAKDCDNFAISGGEPLEQADDVLSILIMLKHLAPDKTRLLYSGTTEKQRALTTEWPAIKKLLDVAVLGPFVVPRIISPVKGLRSSSNQVVEIYTDRVKLEQLERLPSVEVHVAKNGMTILGFPNLKQLTLGD